MQTDNINWRHLERMQHEWLARQAEQAELVKDHDRLEEELGEHLRQPLTPPEALEEATTRARPHKRKPPRPKRRAVACPAASKGYRLSFKCKRGSFPDPNRKEKIIEMVIDTLSPDEARCLFRRKAREEGWEVLYPIEHPTRVEIPA